MGHKLIDARCAPLFDDATIFDRAVRGIEIDARWAPPLVDATTVDRSVAGLPLHLEMVASEGPSAAEADRSDRYRDGFLGGN